MHRMPQEQEDAARMNEDEEKGPTKERAMRRPRAPAMPFPGNCNMHLWAAAVQYYSCLHI